MIYSLGSKKVIREGRVWIAPSAVVTGDVILKNDVNIWYGAVLRGDIENISIDEGTNITDADGDGYGKFEYSVPTGYYALCTKNIQTYG